MGNMKFTLKRSVLPLQICVMAVVLLVATQANADSFNLTEKQTEKLKCVTKKNEEGEKYKDCSKTSVGTYTVIAKIALATLSEQNPEVLTLLAGGIPLETPLALNVGDFAFASTFGDASKKSKVSATWYTTDEKCTKTDAEGECINTKIMRDSTITMSGGLTGVVIKLTGNSDAVLGFGKSPFASTCANAEPGVSTQTAVASMSIGYFNLDLPVAITCRVAETTKDVEGETFNLTNMKITGKLSAAQ